MLGKTPIPDHLIMDPNLTPREFQVMAVILHYCIKYNKRFCWPKQSEIAEHTGSKEDTVKKTINSLKSKAYIGKMRLQNKETKRRQLIYWPTTWVNGSGVPEPNNPYATMQLEMYYKTPHWRKTSLAARERAGHKCQACSTTKGELNAHHNTYDRVGAELPSDLLVLCKDCHQLFHSNRRLGR